MRENWGFLPLAGTRRVLVSNHQPLVREYTFAIEHSLSSYSLYTAMSVLNCLSLLKTPCLRPPVHTVLGSSYTLARGSLSVNPSLGRLRSRTLSLHASRGVQLPPTLRCRQLFSVQWSPHVKPAGSPRIQAASLSLSHVLRATWRDLERDAVD